MRLLRKLPVHCLCSSLHLALLALVLPKHLGHKQNINKVGALFFQHVLLVLWMHEIHATRQLGWIKPG